MNEKLQNTINKAMNIDQNWTTIQALNDLERYLLRHEPPADKPVAMAMNAMIEAEKNKIIFVQFKNLLDENDDLQYGIKQDDFVRCLCCNSSFEMEDVEIIGEASQTFANANDVIDFIYNIAFIELDYKPVDTKGDK